MKKSQIALLLGLALIGAPTVLRAQEAPPPPGNEGPSGHRPPPPPIVGALDANHDGVIDAKEIENASKALRALDRNGDGELTPEEFHPHPHARGRASDPGMDGPGPDLPPPQE